MDGLTQQQQALLARLARDNGLTEAQMAAKLVAEELVRIATLETKVVPWKQAVNAVVK